MPFIVLIATWLLCHANPQSFSALRPISKVFLHARGNRPRHHAPVFGLERRLVVHALNDENSNTEGREREQQQGRRVGVIVRGEKVFEYTIPSFVPKWLLPEIEPPSVFDDPMGDFEPTFGAPPRSKDRPSLAANMDTANATSPHSPGVSVYNWSSTPKWSSSSSKRPAVVKTESTPDPSSISRPTPTATTRRVEGLGVGGATVLVLYTLAYVAINVLGLLEDLANK
mmetsp:Transcript_14406/g.29047  ORF Transcript_14406/g.29047 Transcript_14406/m.29047 type:complete len:227 (-) Transcript_14406:114-794(-)|eukprot:CAMPEP_0167777964 /NCGR_PEP_ID=MMETSP0111_2-20121227/3993_1 /TAXON_ID=91324 /ORGANISM="Lotharella globosa, Strain CCCM811" /LENGTH=226 /DNA_ID=CAMNT_0007668221 /DNA_START=73 /DNA_END=753 /DNA_ORIENTATION=-